ncbi:hypothetical protein HDU67_004113, partial [Dinochytrium kinnereticum]
MVLMPPVRGSSAAVQIAVGRWGEERVPPRGSSAVASGAAAAAAAAAAAGAVGGVGGGGGERMGLVVPDRTVGASLGGVGDGVVYSWNGSFGGVGGGGGEEGEGGSLGVGDLRGGEGVVEGNGMELVNAVMESWNAAAAAAPVTTTDEDVLSLPSILDATLTLVPGTSTTTTTTTTTVATQPPDEDRHHSSSARVSTVTSRMSRADTLGSRKSHVFPIHPTQHATEENFVPVLRGSLVSAASLLGGGGDDPLQASLNGGGDPDLGRLQRSREDAHPPPLPPQPNGVAPPLVLTFNPVLPLPHPPPPPPASSPLPPPVPEKDEASVYHFDEESRAESPASFRTAMQGGSLLRDGWGGQGGEEDEGGEAEE